MIRAPHALWLLHCATAPDEVLEIGDDRDPDR